MKKLLAILISLALLLPLVASAAEYDPANVHLDGTLPIVVDNTEMDAMTIVFAQDPLCKVEPTEMKSLKMLAEDTGVKINWVGIPKANYTEQVNLMLASRQLPDVFWGNIDYSVVTQYMNQEIFLPTEDLIDKYCPIISSVINSNPEYAALTTYPDGHRYGFPTIVESYGLVLTQGPFLINKTWLDKVGKDVPTTLDEFKDVLIAFRDAGDLNGNGEADEIPYAVNFVDSNAYATNNSLFCLMSCFGETATYGDWYPYTKIGDDGKVKFSVLSDAFKQALNFYHDLYKENLLDLDGFSGDGKYQYKLQQNEAMIGAFATWAPSNDIPVKEVYDQYVALPRLVGPNGKMGSANNRSEVQQPSGFLITTACKYPEIAAAIANYMCIPNIAPQINYGVIEDLFTVDENGMLHYRTDDELLNLFHNSFEYMGNQKVDDEQLLMYTTSEEKNSDRLIGTRVYNEGLAHNQFYKKVSIADENSRMPALFEEVRRQIDLIKSIEKSGKKLSSKEREIAILVRENWQAEIIKKEGKTLGFEVITNTGGDLYMSEPALDMLKLANALLHYDESDYLYSFVSSNFIAGGMSKSRMFAIREDSKKSSWKKTKSLDTNQAKELQGLINRSLADSEDDKWRDWNSIVKSLRTVPVLQVIRKLYFVLKPWVQYGEDSKLKQDNYRLNVDLLFEELINSANMDSLTINSFVDILTANIISQKNVDSRMPEVSDADYVIRCVTVHKAKGLEYGAVILPYCSSAINIMKRTDMNVSVMGDGEEGVKIGYQIKVKNNEAIDVFQNDLFNEELEKNERMREEARILYVAMTRAVRSFSWVALDNKKTKCWQNLVWEEE